MNRPTLSVILPNYNHALYLPIALDAMLEQSHPPTEILVVDDCSTDNSLEILYEYASKHPTIKVFRNQQNRGVIYNLNLLANMAVGDFLYSAASDDVVMSGLFEKSINMILQHPQAAFCSGLCLEIDGNGKEFGVVETPGMPREASYISPVQAMNILEQLLGESSLHWFHAPTVVQRREVRLREGDLDQRLRHACDGFLYHVMALKYGCCFIPEPLAKWRKISTGYSVIGESDIGIRLQVVERSKMLMLCKYPDLFPRNYVENWEKRHYFNLQKYALVDFRESNQRFLSNFGKTRYKARPVGNALFRLCFLEKRVESAILGFSVAVSNLRSSFLRSLVRSDFRSYLSRRWERLTVRTTKAWNHFLRQVQPKEDDTWKGNPSPRNLSSIVDAMKLAVAVSFCTGLRLARPVLPIRFGAIDAGDVGALAAFTEAYLCQRDLGLRRSMARLEFFYYEQPGANRQMRKMCDRALRKTHRWVKHLSRANHLLPGYDRNLAAGPDMSDSHLKLMAGRQHLRFTAAEEKMAREQLAGLGMGECREFVCLHANSLSKQASMSRCDQASHFSAATEELTRRGYFVIWMENDRAERIMANGNPMIINYSEENRSDFMDIFLPAKCSFFVGCHSEFAAVATAFRRPVVRVNWMPDPGGSFYGCGDMFIFPRIWHSKENRFMSFEEMINHLERMFPENGANGGHADTLSDPVGNGHRPTAGDGDHESKAAEVFANSPDEILAVVVEMDERLKGRWRSDEKDEALQRTLQSILKTKNSSYSQFGMRAGSRFVRQFHENVGLSSLERPLELRPK